MLTGALADLGLGHPAEARLHERWAEAVGPDLAGVARLERLDGGVLTLGVDHRTWNYLGLELTTPRRREALRQRINAALGQPIITEVHVKLKGTRGR